ncbi:hypothetical protein BC332_02805 [Capsicum chinense]|nr:hypothetical protein BC332_02805 [Capsicum chinense]
MTVNKGTRLTILNDRVTKNEEAMIKQGELLEQLVGKIGEMTSAHVTLARDHTKVAQLLDLIMERLTTIEMHQQCETREGGRGNGLLSIPDHGTPGLRPHGRDPELGAHANLSTEGQGNRQLGSQNTDPSLLKLLQKYKVVFEEPRTLPPIRPRDHAIPLNLGELPELGQCLYNEADLLLTLARANHHSLKYLLDQRVTTAIQRRGFTKLLGLDYEVHFKKGTENRVTDALSIKDENVDMKVRPTATLLAINTNLPFGCKKFIIVMKEHISFIISLLSIFYWRPFWSARYIEKVVSGILLPENEGYGGFLCVQL